MKTVLLVEDDGSIALALGVRLKSAATPVIFITASRTSGLRERAMQLGAVGFLKRPFDATQLADAIEAALLPEDGWERQLRH